MPSFPGPLEAERGVILSLKYQPLALSLAVALLATSSAMAQPLVINTDPLATDTTSGTPATGLGTSPTMRPGTTLQTNSLGSTTGLYGTTSTTPPGPNASTKDPDLILQGQNDRLRPGIYPAQPVPPAFAVPSNEPAQQAPLDWSVGLRGTYTNSNGNGTYVARALPRFTYTHAGTLTDTVISGSADIAKTAGPDWPGVTAAALGATSTIAIDSVTSVTAGAALGYSKDLPGSPGLASGVIIPPETITGALDLGATRQFGKFNVGLTGGLDRTIYGPTTRSDTGVTDNSSQNYWSASAGLRLGYQVTPIFEVFGQAQIQRDIFDNPSTTIADYPDATNRILRAGVDAKWNSIWAANASIGIGQRVFDAAALNEITAQLYSANITYTPNSTLRVTAGLETTLAPPGADTPGVARIENTLLADAQYTANSWLRLRASAGYTLSELVGAGEEKRLNLGAGADYLFNTHTSLNADYGFTARDSTTNGHTDTHQVSLGITVSR